MYNLFIGIDGDDYICDTKETLEEIESSMIQFEKTNRDGVYLYIKRAE